MRWTESDSFSFNKALFLSPSDILKAISSYRKVLRWSYQLEVGEVSGKRHWQIYVMFEKKVRSETVLKNLKSHFYGLWVSHVSDPDGCFNYC